VATTAVPLYGSIKNAQSRTSQSPITICRYRHAQTRPEGAVISKDLPLSEDLRCPFFEPVNGWRPPTLLRRFADAGTPLREVKIAGGLR
jgi:hypothetical protein